MKLGEISYSWKNSDSDKWCRVQTKTSRINRYKCDTDSMNTAFLFYLEFPRVYWKPVFDIFYRKIKTGALWPWCSIGCSCGYSLSPRSWAPFWYCARLRRSMTIRSPSTGTYLLSLGNSFHRRPIMINR